ncbi:MAG: periplasmic heavy metal sensor [Candidatus Desulfatibia sp.]|uniref:periplasmic heavy metal sensor n=1 Tax=Candidatus Desulfatibia sp. TaxID=3101189 RepID=UPI002F2EA1B1
MYNNFTRKIIAILAITAFVGFGSYAFADRSGGYGQGGYGHQGYGMDYGRHGYGMGYGMGHGMMGDGMMGHGQRGYRDDYRSDRGYEGDSTRDEIRQLEEAHEAFYKDTEKLRYKLDDKEMDLSRELGRENPDKQKAAKLQKEISELRSKLDQKRINHLIATRKIAPNTGRGWMRGYGSRGGDCWR